MHNLRAERGGRAAATGMLAGLGLLVLAGCATGPDYERPSVEVPSQWRKLGSSSNIGWSEDWSGIFHDPVLSNLVTEALLNNRDLALAAARVEQAMSSFHAARSAFFPSVNGSADFTTARVGNVPPSPGAESEQFNVFGLLSYEVDLWGRVRRLNESARARYLATVEARRSVELGLVASVASGYFSLRGLDRQLEIARDTLASRSNSLELTIIKFDDGQGIVSELDVAQARTQVASAKSAIANLDRLVSQAENAISFLLGRNPGPINRGFPIDSQWPPGDLPSGLPSDLLLRRPDILAAEQELIAANADIGVARAAYFPAISLTGALGLQSEELGDLLDPSVSKAWTFAPSITAPIFNGGRIRAGVRAAEAGRKAALANYEKAIQNAFREVDDALVGIARYREQLAADTEVVEAERRRLELSTLRYEGGVASYSDVLDAQRFLFNAELTAVQTRNNFLSTMVQLYRALGGGW